MKRLSLIIDIGAIATIIATVISVLASSINTSCEAKNKMMNDILDLAVETKVATQVKMGIPNICHGSNGKAIIPVYFNQKPTDAEMSKYQQGFQDAIESDQKLAKKTEAYTKILGWDSVIWGSGKLLGIGGLETKDFSGSNILLISYLNNYTQKLGVYSEQCSDDSKLAAAYKDIESSYSQFTNELIKMQTSCYSKEIQKILFYLVIWLFLSVVLTIICFIFVAAFKYCRNILSRLNPSKVLTVKKTRSRNRRRG